MATIFKLVNGIVLGIIVGWVFYHIGNGQNSAQDKTGALYLLMMGQAFPVATAVIAVCMYFFFYVLIVLMIL